MTLKKWLGDKLFDLASEVQEGCIVELGTFHGAGAILLARGARAGYGAQVYTIDDFRYRRGWDGEVYGPKNLRVFKERLKLARVHVTLIKKSHHSAARSWSEPIGFWSWDAGRDDRFRKDWLDWSKHIVLGGAVLVRDLMSGGFNTREVIAEIVVEGEFVQEEYHGGVTILRRV